MNIYIAEDYYGKPMGMLLAKDKSYAQVAFEAMGTGHYNIEEIDPINIADGSSVFYILTSKVTKAAYNTAFRVWKRGR